MIDVCVLQRALATTQYEPGLFHAWLAELEPHPLVPSAQSIKYSTGCPQELDAPPVEKLPLFPTQRELGPDGVFGVDTVSAATVTFLQPDQLDTVPSLLQRARALTQYVPAEFHDFETDVDDANDVSVPSPQLNWYQTV